MFEKKIDRKTVIEFVKFGLVGGSNIAVSWIVYLIMIKIGMYYLIANVIAYIAGIINSYIFNSKWVFKSAKKNVRVTLKFIFSNISIMFISSFTLFVIKEYLHQGVIVAQVYVTIIFFIMNYLISKLWIFRRKM